MRCWICWLRAIVGWRRPVVAACRRATSIVCITALVVYRPVNCSYDSRYLDRDERYELARLHDSGASQRKIATQMGRSVSTISRELSRNRDPRTGHYQPERAHWLAWQRQRRPKMSKLAANSVLRRCVQEMLDQRCSPDQVAGRLKVLHHPRGELKRELRACLCSGRTTRRRRGRGGERGGIRDAVSIHDRPEEVESRLIPGHHEGDLIMRSTAHSPPSAPSWSEPPASSPCCTSRTATAPNTSRMPWWTS